MESLAILFIVGLFIYLLSPEKKPEPKDPWEEMGKAIGKAAKSLKDDGGGKKEDKKSDNSGEIFWVIVISALIGVLITFL